MHYSYGSQIFWYRTNKKHLPNITGTMIQHEIVKKMAL